MKFLLQVIWFCLLTLVIAQTEEDMLEEVSDATNDSIITESTPTSTPTSISITITTPTPTSISSTIMPTKSELNHSTINSTVIPHHISPSPPVHNSGFTTEINQGQSQNESWLKQHNRFLIIVFGGLFILGLIIWYIVRSIKGMRKRLAEENAVHEQMMQQIISPMGNQQQYKVTEPSPTLTYDQNAQQNNVQYYK